MLDMCSGSSCAIMSTCSLSTLTQMQETEFAVTPRQQVYCLQLDICVAGTGKISLLQPGKNSFSQDAWINQGRHREGVTKVGSRSCSLSYTTTHDAHASSAKNPLVKPHDHLTDTVGFFADLGRLN